MHSTPSDDHEPVGEGAEISTASTGEWEEYQSIVVFRNDDPKPKWGMPVLEKFNQIFIDEQVPVSHAVIPANTDGEMHNPNGEFCSYMQTMKAEHPDLFEYTQHGYTHEAITEFQGGDSEFAKLPRSDQEARIETGKEYLTECVGESPDVFVPPYNTYDETTVEVLNEQGFHTVSGGPIVTDVFGQSGVFTMGDMTHIMKSEGLIKQWAPEVEHYSAGEMKENFDAAYQNGELYVQMMHYPHLDTDEERDRLRSLIQHMKSKDVRFLTLAEVSTGLESGEIERTSDGWRVYDGDGDGDDDDTNQDPQPAIDAPTSADVGEELTLDASQSTDDGEIVSYEWYVDGEAIESGETVTYQFWSEGERTITLRVTDDDGATAETSATVVVRDEDESNEEPEPVIIGPTDVEVGETATFDGSSSTDDGEIVNYEWYVDGDRVATGETMSHTFTLQGEQTVALRVTDDDGATAWASITVEIESDVNQKPTAVIDAPTTAQTGQTVMLYGSQSTDDGEIVSYEWYVDGDYLGTGESIPHKFYSPGERTVTLRVTDDEGATDEAHTTIVVNDPDSGDGEFAHGDAVQTTTTTPIRLAPNERGIELGVADPGMPGTVSDGPVTTEGELWYKVEFTPSIDGWVKATTLEAQH